MKVNETCELSEEFNIVFVLKALFCEHKFSNGIVKTIDPVDYWDFKKMGSAIFKLSKNWEMCPDSKKL